MKKIHISDYKKSMGKLIDVRHPLDYKKINSPSSTNIYYQKLLNSHSSYLNKKEKYYITCEKGIVSKKTVIQLSYLGYDVTQVYN